MHINDESLNNILKNNYSIDYITITLTKAASDSPVVYTGPGTIYQDRDGILRLKMYHAFKEEPYKEMFSTKASVAPGKILGEEHYFSLSAVDMAGNTWTSKRILLSEHISIPAAGKIIECSLKEITNCDERSPHSDKSKSHLEIFVNGKHDIPANKKEILLDGGFSFNTTEISNDKYYIEIKEKDSYLKISVSSPQEIFNENIPFLFLEALSIIFGKHIKPLLISYVHDDYHNTKLYSYPSKPTEKRIQGPINHRMPRDLEPFKAFIEAYMESFDTLGSEYFGYWHKISGGWQSGLENAALAICVAIEGIAKTSHEKQGYPDEEYLSQTKDAIEKLQHLDIQKRVKDRLMSSLRLALVSNPRTAIINLSKDGWFETELATTWVSLRNMAAHADSIEISDDALQDYLNKTYACLQLFYNLIFIRIGYINRYIDLTKSGWPERLFKKEDGKKIQEQIPDPKNEGTLLANHGLESTAAVPFPPEAPRLKPNVISSIVSSD